MKDHAAAHAVAKQHTLIRINPPTRVQNLSDCYLDLHARHEELKRLAIEVADAATMGDIGIAGRIALRTFLEQDK